MDLFIVESPSKIKKIKEILGDKDFDFGASVGHVAQLPLRDLGVDVSNGFKPSYELSERGREVINKLKRQAARCSRVILATDLDREGEAIAWHLKRYLDLKDGQYVRVVYNEITAPAIKAAIANARDIDMQMVAAQECRVVLDRLVGYPVSQALNKRSTMLLSAGRVQTVALLIIVKRELEIGNFSPTPHYALRTDYLTDQVKWSAYWDYRAFATALNINLNPDNSAADDEGESQEDPKQKSSKVIWTDQSMLNQIRQVLLSNPQFDVISTKSKINKRSAPPPLTTSLMQQAASTKLGFGSDETMSLAQKLYEAGMITYHRTDSKNLSDEAIEEIRAWISQYEVDKGISGLLPASPRHFDNGSNAQEAHEAIRPSHIKNLGNTITDPKQRALYELIWQRAVASQMSAAEYEGTSVRLRSHAMFNSVQLEFEAKGNVQKFAGWRTLIDDDGIEESASKAAAQSLPVINQGQSYQCETLDIEQHKTSQPPRYTEASLVAMLERKGVGRPSTYASIIKKIIVRKYVAIEKRKFLATPLGMEIIKSLEPTFSFVDVDYTSAMESQLDLIAKGQSKFGAVISSLWKDLSAELNMFANESAMFKSTGPTYTCHHCQSVLRRMQSKQKEGEFYWLCSNKESCGLSLPEINGRPPRINGDYGCKECGKPLIVRRTKDRVIRFRCSDKVCGAGYAYNDGTPDFSQNLFSKTSDYKCPTCQANSKEGYLIRRIGKTSQKPFWACNTPNCPVMFPEIADPSSSEGKPNFDFKPLPTTSEHVCPGCQKGRLVPRHSTKWERDFWVCNDDKCKTFVGDVNGVPDPNFKPQQTTSDHVCPRCYKGRLVKRHSTTHDKDFWVCNVKSCKTFISDANGQPDLSQDKSGPKCPLCAAVGHENYLALKKTGTGEYFHCQGLNCGQRVDSDGGQPDGKFMACLNDIGMRFKLVGTRECPDCKVGVMKVTKGSRGPFLACSNYPKCKRTENI
ncbi:MULTISPECIES: type I DNA topoisomerase [Aeromonas]|uniref:type I DNA topoisomerase n=1 Tax=Aeromonas TaxID=642 RepID=UPI002B05E3CB|nr:type I DNA topoisomerase [Aeromonas jandaei]